MVKRFEYNPKSNKITDNQTKREYGWSNLDEIIELVTLLNRINQP